ncbi:hypothetical protein PGT21_004567 [Puccinia graminis f. sp. tritici]|uniref:Uncharacterized protein n=1 Tax=Puccinia graminis f. sp. tritici TaxID=56615 RepID=A0A5B0PR28_PUCGR|nr:hypothetical protein PGT21_004567 [Puccinia graminis f. sp. tritici]
MFGRCLVLIFDFQSVATIKPGQIYGSVSTPSFVTCNSDDPVDYRIQLITSGTAAHVLSLDSVYGISGRVLLLNSPAPPIFNYYIEMVIKTCSVPNLIQDSTDKTFTSGVGLVVGLIKQNSEEDPEFKAGKKLDLWIQDRLVKSFNVKYILPANPKLVNTHIMIRVGREFMFDGYLSGWDLRERTAIITVLGFSPINMGGSGPTSKTTAYSPRSSPINKGRKFSLQHLTESGNGNRDRSVTPTPLASTSNAPLGTSPELDPVDCEPIPVSIPIGKGKSKAVETTSLPKKRRGAPVPDV